jgi:DNA polymerase II small subunit/DNA polymerase delta subunit B
MNIANSLGIDPPQPPKAEIVPVEVELLEKQYETKDADSDYTEVRRNLKCIIEKSQEAIEGIIELAQDSQQPRAYEVVAQLIQSSLEANNKLMDLHRRMKDIKKQEPGKTTNVTNNSIYVGSTADLQKMIRDQRKALDAGTEEPPSGS